MSMFKDVCDMNTAFGNFRGDPRNINWERLEKQANNILDEYKELLEAIAARDEIKTRDAFCDINVFSLGGHHLMGADAEADMKEIYDSNMSKFCKNARELDATCAMYEFRGVTFTVYGSFPRCYLKSDKDQVDRYGDNYPKNKFLKGVETRKPNLRPLVQSTLTGPMSEEAQRLLDKHSETLRR